VDLLECPIQAYDWGSRTAIAAMQHRQPTGEPEAELWIGAHPRAPAQLVRHGQSRQLDEVIAADPAAELGAGAATRWDGRLPFLLKVLAVAKPLSLQAHPSLAQARAGFAAEEAAGVPIDARDRLFRDDNHKPELICAVSPFTALCGFRPVSTSIDLLEALGGDDLGAEIVDILRADPDGKGLRRARVTALDASSERAERALVEVRSKAAQGVAGFELESRWLTALIDDRPRDPAVMVAALLDLVVLDPGQALFLAAGNLHCYLDGVGVEVMANSDNVLRGGLTSKHIDVDALARVVVTEPSTAEIQNPAGPVHTYRVPAPEFALTRIRLDGGQADLPPGAAAGVVVAGELTLTIDGEERDLASGSTVWVPASDGPRRATGAGTLFLATEGDTPPVGGM
jgi:mannose-6-phosphate isomerase